MPATHHVRRPHQPPAHPVLALHRRNARNLSPRVRGSLLPSKRHQQGHKPTDHRPPQEEVDQKYGPPTGCTASLPYADYEPDEEVACSGYWHRSDLPYTNDEARQEVNPEHHHHMSKPTSYSKHYKRHKPHIQIYVIDILITPHYFTPQYLWPPYIPPAWRRRPRVRGPLMLLALCPEYPSPPRSRQARPHSRRLLPIPTTSGAESPLQPPLPALTDLRPTGAIPSSAIGRPTTKRGSALAFRNKLRTPMQPPRGLLTEPGSR